MAFIWNPEPSLPPKVPPFIISPDKTSFKVHVVANTVNVGGAVSYNTPNVGYDVVYELETLNTTHMRVLTGNVEHANLGIAFINTALITQATLNTSNITHATINLGYFTGNATANFSMVTKEYVDLKIAAISDGSGPDTTANLITTKGDLLVGFAQNTAHRLGAGADGQILSVQGSSNTGVQWVDETTTELAINLDIGTHYHPSFKFSQILLKHADGIIMDDGELVPGWDNLVADITVSGAGGLDTGTEQASRWYQVWAIRNSSSGAKALLLRRIGERALNQSWTGWNVNINALLGYGAVDLPFPAMRFITKYSQSFIPSVTGLFRSIVFRCRPGAGPTDGRKSVGNMWVTLETDDGTGNASGTVLSTSQTINNIDIGNPSNRVVDLFFVFDTAATVSSGGKYIAVINQEWTINVGFSSSGHANVFGVFFAGNTAPLGPGQQAWMANVGYHQPGTYSPYANVGYGDCRGYNVATSSWATTANIGGPSDLHFRLYIEEVPSVIVLPSGYNQKSLLSFVRNDSAGNFKEYRQKDKTLMMGFDPSWQFDTHDVTLPFPFSIAGLIDLIDFVPPVPCFSQFFSRPINGQFSISGLRMGTIQGLDIEDVVLDTYRHGMYVHGFGAQPMGLVNTIPLDKNQAVLVVDTVLAAGLQNNVLITSITF